MKTTILSQDGVTQIVLTPETGFEKDIVNKYGKNAVAAQFFNGSFSECKGGWIHGYQSVNSLMIVCRDGEPK
jgi:hypothetical protein